jgi:osmotically inducible lipoprotein OsmB
LRPERPGKPPKAAHSNSYWHCHIHATILLLNRHESFVSTILPKLDLPACRQNICVMKRSATMSRLTLPSLLLTASLALLAGCGDTAGQRALTGGAIGAGGGAIIGGATGMGAGTGALIGAGAGALTGAATTRH